MTQSVLAPGEIIRTSGKFTKPTKIPGKNYSKDEVVIRNADSGKGMIGAILLNLFIIKYSEKKIIKNYIYRPYEKKVMGIKGRRVHMIEELSETIISFQRGKASNGMPEKRLCSPCRC